MYVLELRLYTPFFLEHSCGQFDIRNWGCMFRHRPVCTWNLRCLFWLYSTCISVCIGFLGKSMRSTWCVDFDMHVLICTCMHPIFWQIFEAKLIWWTWDVWICTYVHLFDCRSMWRFDLMNLRFRFWFIPVFLFGMDNSSELGGKNLGWMSLHSWQNQITSET